MARPVQSINAGSMADIAFLLLVFFLVTTTMDVDTGIARKLPPPYDPSVELPPVIERNVFVVLVNATDQLMVEGNRGVLSTLRQDTKDFFLNPTNDENLSERVMKNIDLLGDVMVSKGVVSLQNDRGTSYDMYIKVQNEIAAGINELRDELSKEKFGVNFSDLRGEDKIKAIKKARPVSVSEAEPKNIGG